MKRSLRAGWGLMVLAASACGTGPISNVTSESDASSSENRNPAKKPRSDVGVSDSGVASADERICDGTESLRLRFYLAPNLGREVTGGTVRVELGTSSFALDGRCRYWINGGWTNHVASRDLGWQTGTLEPGLEAMLDSVLNLHELASLSDEKCAPSGINDGSPWVISSPYSAAYCEPRPVDNPFYTAWALIESEALTLRTQGVPVSGPIRITTRPSGGFIETFAWPLSDDPSMFIIDDPQPGENFLIEDLMDAEALRAMRAEFLEKRGDTSLFWGDGIDAVGGDVQVSVFLRDAIPYEGADGLLPF